MSMFQRLFLNLGLQTVRSSCSLGALNKCSVSGQHKEHSIKKILDLLVFCLLSPHYCKNNTSNYIWRNSGESNDTIEDAPIQTHNLYDLVKTLTTIFLKNEPKRLRPKLLSSTFGDMYQPRWKSSILKCITNIIKWYKS
jgi:hypothetical protein